MENRYHLSIYNVVVKLEYINTLKTWRKEYHNTSQTNKMIVEVILVALHEQKVCFCRRKQDIGECSFH